MLKFKRKFRRLRVNFLSVCLGGGEGEQSNLYLDRLAVEVSRSQKIRHTNTQSVGLLGMNDHPVTQAATYTRNGYQCHQRDSNLRSQHSRDEIRLRPHDHRDRPLPLLCTHSCYFVYCKYAAGCIITRHQVSVGPQYGAYCMSSFWLTEF